MRLTILNQKNITLSINVDGYDLNLKQQKRYKDKKLELIEHKIKHQEGKILEVKGKIRNLTRNLYLI